MVVPDDAAVVDAILADVRCDPLQLVQVLRRVQAVHGCVPGPTRHHISRALGVPLAQIHGVVEFYHFLSSEPQGQYCVRLSDNITDRMQGSAALLTRLCRGLAVTRATTRADERVSVDYTSCTGMSDQGPGALVNGLAVTRLDEGRVDQMVRLIEDAVPVSQWPAAWFQVHENIRRRDLTLRTSVEPGAAIDAVLHRGPDAILKELSASGLRGRGGAGFNTALKWKFCREAPWTPRYVTCNADEGEPGTFKDRVLLAAHADLVFEGMTLCGLIVGAQQGFLYLRGEYEFLAAHLAEVLRRRRDDGLLGDDIRGTGKSFDIAVHLGAGAYVAGEETALIESLEGRRAVPRIRPPFLATNGYLQHPTANNNVETFAQAAQVAVMGGSWFAAAGTEKSKGTKLLSVSGDVAHPGIYEYPWGVTVREVYENAGARGTPAAVQVGGPSGALVGPPAFERRVAYEDLPTGGSFMVFDDSRDLLEVVRNFARFFARESCGFCTPCRVGTQVLLRNIERVCAGLGTEYELEEIEEIGRIVKAMSHCGLGQAAANPLLDSLKAFRGRYEARLASHEFVPGFDLDGALAESRSLTGRDDALAHLAR